RARRWPVSTIVHSAAGAPSGPAPTRKRATSSIGFWVAERPTRSEERRVGKEGSAGGRPCQLNEKDIEREPADTRTSYANCAGSVHGRRVEDDVVASLFFFQAEDGIRDFHVTGVQTCALPISRARRWPVSTIVHSAAGAPSGPAPTRKRATSSIGFWVAERPT